MQKQHRHATLIDKLGGGISIARDLWGEKACRSARIVERVYKWKKNGVPWRWRQPVADLAEERGVPVPAGFLASGHRRPRPSAPSQPLLQAAE